MTHRLDLDEMDEDKLRDEIREREKLHLAGMCDYCGNPRDTPSCKFPERHKHIESQTVFASPSTYRLTRWLRDHPDVYTAVLEALQTPVATCEGQEGCEGKVLWPTPSMTRYEWDGEGEDPNRDHQFCPLCSSEYVLQMTHQLDDYYAGLL